MRLFDLAAIGVFVLAGTASAQVAILQIRVVEGEGAVHAPGSRSIRPLTVEITDETGKPVDQAAVSFHLPDDGPGGVFLSGLRTEVVMTGADGRASIRGLQWNSTPGRLQIRIVASREQARAGMISFHYIGESGMKARAPSTSARAPVNAPKPAAATASHGRTKWVVLATLLAAGVSAGVVNGSRSKQTAAAAVPAAPSAPALSIGNPSITVGKP